MYWFCDSVGGLLRILSPSPPAIGPGSTDLTHEAGGGPSGADFSASELGIELQSWPAATTPSPTSPNFSTAEANCPAGQIIYHTECQLPRLPEPAVLNTSRSITSSTSLVLLPPSSASSFTDTTGSGSGSSSSSNSLEEIGHDTTHKKRVRKKQEASELCWRAYWG
ncbi:hypothetical protein GGS26DRAFT_589630 [Hypomontagnella submonticulosa]|nr:hypothetical protein GGS26DRAFT_589630 [Hypomontagnella submonticulosa]